MSFTYQQLRHYTEAELRKVVQQHRHGPEIWSMLHACDHSYNPQYQGLSTALDYLTFPADTLECLGHNLEIRINWDPQPDGMDSVDFLVINRYMKEGSETPNFHYRTIKLGELPHPHSSRTQIVIEEHALLMSTNTPPPERFDNAQMLKKVKASDTLFGQSRIYVGFPHPTEEVRIPIRVYQGRATQQGVNYLEHHKARLNHVTPVMLQTDRDLSVNLIIYQAMCKIMADRLQTTPVYHLTGTDELETVCTQWPTPMGEKTDVMVLMGKDVVLDQLDTLLRVIRARLIQPIEVIILCEDDLDYTII